MELHMYVCDAVSDRAGGQMTDMFPVPARSGRTTAKTI